MIYLMKGGEIRIMGEDGVLSHVNYDLDYYIESKDEYCAVEDGFTIKDFFLIVEKNSECFVSRFSGLILNYVSEVKSLEKVECPIDCLYFSWLCTEKDGYMKENILRYPIFTQDYVDMVGEMQSDENDFEDVDKDEDAEEDPFSIDEFSLSEIKDAKIILNEKFDVYKYEDNLEGDVMKIGPETIPMFSSNKRFSFFDIIYETVFTLCPDLEFDIEDLDDDPFEAIEPEEKSPCSKNEDEGKSKKSGINNLYKQLNDLEELL
jgi:hypothetical protein